MDSKQTHTTRQAKDERSNRTGDERQHSGDAPVVDLIALRHAVVAPAQARPEQILALQQRYGNRAVSRLIQRELTRDHVYSRKQFQDGVVAPEENAPEKKNYDELMRRLGVLDNSLRKMHEQMPYLQDQFGPGDVVPTRKKDCLVNLEKAVNSVGNSPPRMIEDIDTILEQVGWQPNTTGGKFATTRKKVAELSKTVGKNIGKLFGAREQAQEQAQPETADPSQVLYAKLADLKEQLSHLGEQITPIANQVEDRLHHYEQIIAQDEAQARSNLEQAKAQAKSGTFRPGQGEVRDASFGSGATATVARVDYPAQTTGNQSGSEKYKTVFKPEPTKTPEAALIGKGSISDSTPNLTLRAVAASKINNLLGLHVIARTELGFHEQLGFGQVMQLVEKGVQPRSKAKIEIANASKEKVAEIQQWLKRESERSKNLSYSKVVEKQKSDGQQGEKAWYLEETYSPNIDWKNPVLRQELANLQLLDALIANGDRHMENYFIELNDQGEPTGVIGIDSDLGFGASFVDPAGRIDKIEGLPPAVDAQVAARFCAVTEDQIRETVSGLLTNLEIESLILRFQIIKGMLEAKNADNTYKIPRISSDTAQGKQQWSQLQAETIRAYWAREQDWQLKNYKPQGRVLSPNLAEQFLQTRLKLVTNTPVMGGHRSK